jgi:hypothetical protein
MSEERILLLLVVRRGDLIHYFSRIHPMVGNEAWNYPVLAFVLSHCSVRGRRKFPSLSSASPNLSEHFLTSEDVEGQALMPQYSQPNLDLSKKIPFPL